MEKYVPDMYQKSIFTIDYQKLQTNGIKCILFDLDNTIAPVNEKRPSQRVIDLFSNLKERGFIVVIFSNSHKSRLQPFKDETGVEYCPFACKPKSKKFYEVMNQYNVDESEVAIIGDQMLTDILGGNRVGITTILIQPISKSDFIGTKFNRVLESIIIRRLSKKNLFYRGKFYE